MGSCFNTEQPQHNTEQPQHADSDNENSTSSGNHVKQLDQQQSIATVPKTKCTKCGQFHGTEAQKGFCSQCYVAEYGVASYVQSTPARASVPLRLEQEMQTYVHALKQYTTLLDIAIDLVAEYALNPMEFYQVSEDRAQRQTKLNDLMFENADTMKKQMKRTLTFAIDKNDYTEFVDLLARYQPWMSIKDALHILSPLSDKKVQNGYKAIGLMYFVCDAGLDDGIHLQKFTSFCMQNEVSTAVCYRFHNFGAGGCLYWCGQQVMRDHPINLAKNVDALQSELVTIPKQRMLSNMRQSYDVSQFLEQQN